MTRYTVTLVGGIIACRMLGMTWASVQWLAAAMTVGLGFGLQEIFANLVSGLILLFERPIRIGDLVTELRKLGATVREDADGMTIVPGPLQATRIATYDDHRMAMSLALVGLKVRGVLIENPACTRKTYPHFFDELQRISRQ